MIETTLVILCAGNSTRFSLDTKKQWLRVGDEPLWLDVTKRLSSYIKFDEIVIVGHKDEIKYMNNFTDDYTIVAGGSTRQESMSNALQYVTSKYTMVTDVARCCVPKDIILNLITNRDKASVIVPALNAIDTIVYEDSTINRENVKIIQTPQLSQTDILKQALKTNIEFTDDSSAIKSINGTVYYIKGSEESRKLTNGTEMQNINCMKTPSKDIFSGIGVDIHSFENNKPMVLGGINIPSTFGFKAHSDGDVLIHSVIDALLGACGAGDIGEFFPDTDPKYKGINSKELLTYIVTFIRNVGYTIINIDITILAEVPKINPYKNEMKRVLSKLLNISKYKINIKATTGEKMGYIGRSEGVCVQSIANLKYYDWTQK